MIKIISSVVFDNRNCGIWYTSNFEFRRRFVHCRKIKLRYLFYEI